MTRFSPEWRALQAQRARNLTGADRHGGVYAPTTQRLITITFRTPEEAVAWDELDEDEAFAVLAAAAAARKADRERSETQT